MEDAIEDQSLPKGRSSSSKRMRSATKFMVDKSTKACSASKRLKISCSLSMENILKGDARQLLDNQADVSLTLAKHFMLNYGKDSNLVFSPTSVQVILAIVAAGSGAGTLDQLLSFLKAKSIDDLNHLYLHLVALVFAKSSDGLCLSFANGVWVDKSVSVKPPFKHVVSNLYKAAFQQVDFQNKPDDVLNLVNSWIKKETNGLIQKVLPAGSVKSLTRLIFANALYFKGEWMTRFDKSKTKSFKFHLLNGDSVEVPFMTSYKKQFVRVFNGFKVLNLPYKQGKNLYSDKLSFSMYIFLPDAKDGLPALLEKAGSEPGFLERHIPSREVELRQFRIPKFKFEYSIEMTQALQKLGLDLPFDPNVGLSEMVDDPNPLFVSNIFHKSFIEVDEKGTEASAATGVYAAECCAMIQLAPIDFVADHPFLFVIRENTSGIVQFMGQVLNPSLK
ncbi:serpin-ZX-like [Apium graveolens]|uniref:serpin-ZX-like n=1 Tax=Apium graveolens TaxID=4045 RepID=UPI003D79D4E3